MQTDGDTIKVETTDISFNSLFEMQRGGYATASAETAASFNSLLEMPTRCASMNSQSASTVSILCLRCLRCGGAVLVCGPVQARFNSLFEMPSMMALQARVDSTSVSILCLRCGAAEVAQAEAPRRCEFQFSV